jgi:hypothetical protein
MRHCRITIEASDIALITGKSLRTARRMMREMRRIYQKESYQYITAEEFSVYSGIPVDQVYEYLQRMG